MNFDLDDTQTSVVGLYRQILEAEVTPGRVRATENSGLDRPLWKTLVGAGLVGLPVAESIGGAGLDTLASALVVHEFGRTMAPIPAAEVLTTAAVVSQHRGGPPEEIVAFAPFEAQDSTFRYVPGGAVASHVVGLADGQLVVVGASDATRVTDSGDLPTAHVAVVDPVVLAESGQADFAAMVAKWEALVSSLLTGLAEHALALGVAYVKERHQFGRPIGAFQAVAHELANVATAVDGSRLLACEAAWAQDNLEPTRARVLARMALVNAVDVAKSATYASVHFHGGYGFMLEYDPQLYYRRARAIAALVGGLRGRTSIGRDYVTTGSEH